MRNQPKRHSLTEGQEGAFKYIRDRVSNLNGSGESVTLKGYAGSGKTTTLRHLARRLGPEFSDTYMMAPTHKAAEVLGRKTGREVTTVHSALGLRPKPDGKGGYKFVPTGQGQKYFAWGSLCLVDEASMIPQRLYDMLEDIRTDYNLAMIYCGDPAQLPPVNENPSPALEEGRGYMLENIVRQERDNPIIQTSMEVREHDGAGNYRFSENYSEDKGVEIGSSRTDLIEKAVEAFDTPEYRKRGDHVRILAYRNDVVETYNEICRELLYGDTGEQFIDGEWLVATQPWYGANGDEMRPIVQNSEEFVVTGKERSSLYEFETWTLEVSPSPDSNEVKYIEVLNRDELDRYNRKLDELAERAKNGGDWGKYYDYKEHFAHVDYSYAMTTHKAQGSTFTKTFVDAEDINTCPNPAEIQRLKYVAVTRASDKLVVFDS